MADYVTTEPAFDFERGDFVIINGRPKMVVGMDRLRSWIGKGTANAKRTVQDI